MIIFVPWAAAPGDYVKNISTGEIKRVMNVNNVHDSVLAQVDDNEPFYDYSGWWAQHEYLVMLEIYAESTPLEYIPEIRQKLLT